MDRSEFEKRTAKAREIILAAMCKAGSGHVGGAFSLVEIVTALYNGIMKVDPKNPRWDERDRLVLSKGHAGPVLYEALAQRGFFPMEWMDTINQGGTRLPSHADQNQTPGIDMTTGSLGQGLSCACGLALAAKRDAKKHTVFCIIGDGESNEGQNWEAALFAAQFKLDNLVAICDYNKLQIDGTTGEVMNLDPLPAKWEAFGWETFEMDGHDMDQIYSTIAQAQKVSGKPAMIIAHTVKGRGHVEYADSVSCHNVKLNPSDADKVLAGLQA